MHIGKHILFWVLSTLLLVIVFGNAYDDYISSFYFITFLLPVAMATSYFFNYFLVPRYLLQRKYARFAIYTAYLTVVSLYLQMVVIYVMFILIANYNTGNLAPEMKNIFVPATTIYLIVLMKAFYLLFRRFRESEFQIHELHHQKEASKIEFITVRADRAHQQLKTDDILYLESLSDYVKIHTTDRTVITRENISSFEEILPEHFMRIHRSYIINQQFVTHFSNSSVSINKAELPISRTYKSSVLQVLKQEPASS